MKKSKLTGALAVGGGLKHAVVPYIITGEENNGYSKGDILDANYVKLLINNNTIPDDIQANTLTLNSGQIIADGEFGFYDKALNPRLVYYDNGSFEFFSIEGDPYIHFNGLGCSLNSDELFIGSNYLGAEIYGLGVNIITNRFGIGQTYCYITMNNGIFTILAPGGLRMGDGRTRFVPLFFSSDGSGQYKNGDTAIMWDMSWLQINKIYKLEQDTSEKDLFERVSDLETPKTTREDNPKVGQCVFDTTLGKPIWCKTAKTDTTAAVWVDATGATV